MKDEQPPSTNGPGIRRWLRRAVAAICGAPRDRDELMEVLSAVQRQGLIDSNGLEMLQGVLEVSDTHVRDIMIPRPHMVVLERDADVKDLLPMILESGHSRFPVIGDDRDEVVGVLLAKDLLRYYAEQGNARFDIRECLRKVAFIPESKRLNILLKDFRTSRNHMAIVVDEYGGVSGLLTIEDVIEQIVGDIGDEHDIEEDAYIVSESDDRYSVRGLTRIDDFNEFFDCQIDDENFDTVAGLIMHGLGRLPRRGEIVTIDGFDFKVTRGDRRRIHTVQVTRAGKSGVARTREARS